MITIQFTAIDEEATTHVALDSEKIIDAQELTNFRQQGDEVLMTEMINCITTTTTMIFEL